VVCAFGSGEAALWEGLLSGETRVAPCTALGGRRVAIVPLDSAGADRTVALVREAARQLQASAAWRAVQDRTPAARLAVCLGTTQGAIQTWEHHQRQLAADAAHRPPLPHLADPTLELARTLGARGAVQTLSMACASGTAAIGLAASWIEHGACDAAVAGGADAGSAFVYDGFAGLRALDPETPRPFDRERAGLGVGEGAALVLLQRGRCGGAPLVAGFGLSADAHHLTGPDPTGGGLARAIGAALADAALAGEPQTVDFVNAHGTATVFNDLMESKALSLALGDHAARVPTNSIKGAIGHAMGAAGAIEAVLCAMVLERGVIPPTTGLRVLDPAIALDVVSGAPRRADVRCALSTSAGFGGINAALLLCAG